jgi:hypothetical protein
MILKNLERNVSVVLNPSKEFINVEIGRVLDGLQIPLKAKMIKLKGSYM